MEGVVKVQRRAGVDACFDTSVLAGQGSALRERCTTWKSCSRGEWIGQPLVRERERERASSQSSCWPTESAYRTTTDDKTLSRPWPKLSLIHI